MTTTVDADKTTTWGDCPDPDCPFYGRLRYRIEPGTACYEANGDRGCDSELRWWDRWHNGQHRSSHPGNPYAECLAAR